VDERKNQHNQIEQTRLTIANARRELKGEEPFEDLEALEDWQDQQAADLDNTDEELDFVIQEGGHIMADLLELDQRMASILMPTQFAAKTEAP
jgi:carboxyl-terminal processing protease